MDQLSSAGRDCCFWRDVLFKKRNRIVPGAPCNISSLSDLGDILEFKEDRKIRVLHLLGSPSPPSRDEIKKEEENHEEYESGGYWFENAFPSRGSIPPPLFALTPAKPSHRIFNKFEPQEPRKIPEVNNTPMLSVSSNRLTRKTIMTDDIYNVDDDDDDDVEMAEETPKSELLIGALSNNSQVLLQITADTTSSIKSLNESINKSIEDVIVIPDPGESSTDSPGGNNREHHDAASDPSIEDNLVFENSCLGGSANIAFEDEEIPSNGADERDAQQRNEDNNTLLSENSNNLHGEDHGECYPQTEILPENYKPLLFFIHGIGGSANIWRNQIQYFCNLGFEIVAPDLLGHGFSSTPDNVKAYTFRKILCDLLKIFDHYVFPKRKVIIVGHGYGCSFATALSRVRNQNVIHIILCGSGGPTPLSPPPYISHSLCCGLFLHGLFKCGKNKQRQQYQKSLKFPKSLDIPKYVFNHIIAGQSWPEGDVTFHRKINIPTLLIYGLKDKYVSLVEMCEMERTITKSYLELLPMAGHYLMIDHSRELNTMIRKFMEKYENHYYD